MDEPQFFFLPSLDPVSNLKGLNSEAPVGAFGLLQSFFKPEIDIGILAVHVVLSGEQTKYASEWSHPRQSPTVHVCSMSIGILDRALSSHRVPLCVCVSATGNRSSIHLAY